MTALGGLRTHHNEGIKAKQEQTMLQLEQRLRATYCHQYERKYQCIGAAEPDGGPDQQEKDIQQYGQSGYARLHPLFYKLVMKVIVQEAPVGPACAGIHVHSHILLVQQVLAVAEPPEKARLLVR